MNANACLDLKVRAVERLGKAGAPGAPGASGSGVYRLVLESPGWESWLPGQFVMVRPRAWGLEPLWARPFSIHRLDQDGLVLLVAVVGRGTAALSLLAPGEAVTVWGPLGNGFAVLPDGPTLLLAGGIGLAPFLGYLDRHPALGNLRLIFGHTAPLDCFPFQDMAARVKAEHFHDQGPDDLPAFLAVLDERIGQCARGLVLACGPGPFLRSVKALAARHKARAQLSLENRMACGVGACLGCVTRLSRGAGDGLPVQVCSQGPVFWADEVELEGGC